MSYYCFFNVKSKNHESYSKYFDTYSNSKLM